jgi:hypothetical protein
VLHESAVKMEATRLRQAIANALEVLGAPYGATISSLLCHPGYKDSASQETGY